mmetsp:Transcript_61911/g.186795  ORF Transcript_61911/g.186795 Transcript_61911/m.186795 type:complete len:84 (+) Transcript_61911:68-319(+)
MDFIDHYYMSLPCSLRPRMCKPVGSSVLFPIAYPRASSTVGRMPFPAFSNGMDQLCSMYEEQPFARRCGPKLCGPQTTIEGEL